MSSKNQDAKPRAEINKHMQWSDEKGKYECKYLRFERRFVPESPTKCETEESNCGSSRGMLSPVVRTDSLKRGSLGWWKVSYSLEVSTRMLYVFLLDRRDANQCLLYFRYTVTSILNWRRWREIT